MADDQRLFLAILSWINAGGARETIENARIDCDLVASKLCTPIHCVSLAPARENLENDFEITSKFLAMIPQYQYW